MDIKRRLKHTRVWFMALLLLTAAVLAALIFYRPNYYKADAIGNITAGGQYRSTIRFAADQPVEMAIAVSQHVYPATFGDNKPDTVILVPEDDWQAAVLATQIIHFPVNAPILYTGRDRIPDATLAEIKRLEPEGFFLDGNIKVIVIGNVHDNVLKQLQEEKLKYRVLSAPTAEQLGSLVDDYKAMIHADHDDQVIVVPTDNPAYALPATAWVAHMGHTILFVSPEGLHESTIRSLARRPQDSYIYIFAGEDVLSEKIVNELSSYGHVQRIPGSNPVELAKGFAGYQDQGRNFGWWIGRSTRSFGWGIAEAGHNYTFVNPDYPLLAIPAAILSHMGKHGPMLLLSKNQVPDPVNTYLEMVRPDFISPQEQLFNHGWIIGDEQIISTDVQIQIDKLLHTKERGQGQ